MSDSSEDEFSFNKAFTGRRSFDVATASSMLSPLFERLSLSPSEPQAEKKKYESKSEHGSFDVAAASSMLSPLFERLSLPPSELQAERKKYESKSEHGAELPPIGDNKLPNLEEVQKPPEKYIKISERDDDLIQTCLASCGKTYFDLDKMIEGYFLTEPDYLEKTKVEEIFYCSNEWMTLDISSIEKVINPFLWLSYKLKKAQCRNENNYVTKQRFFHGTSQSSLDNICQNNFDWRLAGQSKGHKFGKGVSFTPDAFYASHYGDGETMILAYVLVGKKCTGNQYTEVPPDINDTTTNGKGSVYVKYDDCHFYPAYIIHY